MVRLGPWEIAIIVIIILLVFGAGKLPQVGTAIGKTVRSFRKVQHGEEDEEAPQAESKTTRKRAVSRTTKVKS